MHHNHALGDLAPSKENKGMIDALRDLCGVQRWSGDVSFTIPSPGSGRSWYRVTDTCNWADGPEAVAIPGSETWIGNAGASYTLCGRAVLLLIAK